MIELTQLVAKLRFHVIFMFSTCFTSSGRHVRLYWVLLLALAGSSTARAQVPPQRALVSPVPTVQSIAANSQPPVVSDSGLQDTSSASTVDSLSERIDGIEAQLKKNVAAEKKLAEKDKKEPINPLDKFKEKWNVKLGGHVQMDYVNWANASPTIVGAQDYFEFRRLRLVAEGTGYGVYDFRLQMTLEPETVGETQPLGTVSSPDVKDAYLSINEIPGLGRFRIGNFFVPFSLEQVTNDTNNIFMERSIPSQGVFAADREVGMALYNCTEDQYVTWTSGIFLDSISEGLKERIDDNQGYRVSGRLT